MPSAAEPPSSPTAFVQGWPSAPAIGKTTAASKTQLDDSLLRLQRNSRRRISLSDPILRAVHFLISTARDPRLCGQSLIVLPRAGYCSIINFNRNASYGGPEQRRKTRASLFNQFSIKICFVQQKSYKSSVQEKLEKFNRELGSQRVSIKQSLNLQMLPEDRRVEFSEETGLYMASPQITYISPHCKSGIELRQSRPAGQQARKVLRKLKP